MTLSDRSILNRLNHLNPKLIDPFIRNNLQPASVDLTLHNTFLVPLLTPWYTEPGAEENVIRLDKVRGESPAHRYNHVEQDRYVLHHGQFVLGSTYEWVNIPDNLVASVEGKSSLGRLGLFVHITAGFCDPGFSGRITLEFLNMNPRPIELVAGLRICQIAFQELRSPAIWPYGSPMLDSKYQDQLATTGSRYRG